MRYVITVTNDVTHYETKSFFLKKCNTSKSVSDIKHEYVFNVMVFFTGRFIMFSMITNIYNKKTKGPTIMEFFTATGKLKKFFFLTTRDVRCVHHG